MAQRFADSDELYTFLLGFVNVERGQKTVFKLDRMRYLCESLGDPQGAYRTIHVAGSKGKGSVSAMIARALQASGRRVGLYTSPHLLRWKERMSLAGDEMPEEIVLAAAAEVLPLMEGKGPTDFPGGELPTYFELTTLIAFCAFRLAGCDSAVVETGLGGRLDSTNVLPSEASVITPIELEHTEWLGDTIPLIAAEKAGIVKPGKPCFLSRQRDEAREVFARTCADRGSPLREAPVLARAGEVSIGPGGTTARISFAPSSPMGARFPGGIGARTPMIGAIQAENMALALLAAGETEASLGPEEAARGLARAFLPARFQILSRAPPVILDGAHTPASIGLALESLETLFPGPKALLFACAEDKRHKEMAAALAPKFERITLTRPGAFKRGDLAALASSFVEAGASFRATEDHVEAIARAREEAAALGLPLLVTGSFYLCSAFAESFPA
jgi:dihydrofolate synthase/folylpolyglutamate synthase